MWASAQDISFWDIGLAGGVLIKKPEDRAVVYASWTLPDGRTVPGSAGWQFYHHRGLMDIKGSVPGFSSFLSRFTHPEELVCVTLMANKEGVDFTNLGRKIAGAFGDLLSTNYDDTRLFLMEGQFSADETVNRLEEQLNGYPGVCQIRSCRERGGGRIGTETDNGSRVRSAEGWNRTYAGGPEHRAGASSEDRGMGR